MRKYKFLFSLMPVYIFVLFAFYFASLCYSDIVTSVREDQVLIQQHCIVIDAGHGQPDGGATSYNGTLEADINLDMARKLENILHLLGFKTKMIRSDENGVFTEGNTIASKKVSDLKNRVQLTNHTTGAILVSIHQNYYSDSRYSGAQVFYADTPGSKPLGTDIQDALRKYINPQNNRQSKSAEGIYLMEKISCPGVLIECGFLSNPEESMKLETNTYQNELCCAIGVSLGKHINSLHTLS